MQWETVVVIVAPIVGLLCCLSLVRCFFSCFVVSRKHPSVVVPVRYLPERERLPDEPEDYKRRLSRRMRRRARVRRFLLSFSQRKQREEDDEDEDWESETESEDDMDDGEREKGRDEPWLSRSMKSLRSFILTGRLTVPASNNNSARKKSRKKRRAQSYHDFSHSHDEEEEGRRPKRFVSQERLRRNATRKQVLQQSLEAEEKKESDDDNESIEEHAMAILDLEEAHEERVKSILDLRRQQRTAQREERRRAGEIDHVALNAGPPPAQVPANYRALVSVPNFEPETLLYKRILYLWEGNKGHKPNGWFIATVVGVSVKRNCNFQIKYDRKETKSLFVDGVHAVMLSFEGNSAYGRRWVVVEKIQQENKPA